MSDLISREALKEHKVIIPIGNIIGGVRCGKTRELIIKEYQKGWNDAIDTIIDIAPTVDPEITEKQAITAIINSGWLVNHDKELRDKWKRPKGKWITDNLNNTICNNCGGIRRDNRVDYIAFCNKCGADMRGAE